MVYVVLVNHLLKAVQNGVQAYSFVYRPVGVCFKSVQEIFLIKPMKGIDDLIRKPNKAINRINRVSQVGCQEPYSKRKRGAVSFCGQLTTLDGNIVKELLHGSV